VGVSARRPDGLGRDTRSPSRWNPVLNSRWYPIEDAPWSPPGRALAARVSRKSLPARRPSVRSRLCGRSGLVPASLACAA